MEGFYYEKERMNRMAANPNDTKMVRDLLGGIVPQTLNEEGTYSVLANGDVSNVDFSREKLLRDHLGGVLPQQYFDVDKGRFVPGIIGGGGDVSQTDLLNLSSEVNGKVDQVAQQLAQKASYEDLAEISTGTPLFASSLSGMTDNTRLYVNTTDGYLYAYNSASSVFASTGKLYQAQGIAKESVTSINLTKGLQNEITEYQKEVKGYKKINNTEGMVFGNSNPSGITRIFIDHITTSSSQLRQIKLGAAVGGILKVKLFKSNFNETFRYLREFSLTVKEGINTFELDEYLPANTYIGIYSDSVRIQTTDHTSYNKATNFYYATGDLTTDTTAVLPSSQTTLMNFGFSVVEDNTNSTNIKYDNKEVTEVGILARRNASLLPTRTRLFNHNNGQGAICKEVRFFSNNHGTIKLKVFKKTEDNLFKHVKDYSEYVVEKGYNTIKTDIFLPSNGYLGWYTDDAIVPFKDISTAPISELDAYAALYWTAEGDVSNDSIFTKSNDVNRVFIQVVLVTESLTNQVAQLTNEISNTQQHQVIVSSGGGKLNPLYISTPEGYNQPYHPSVLYLDNGWNGYKYWMAQTPYPIGGTPYRDRWEYPCIYASHDGVDWKPIGNNPIDNLTQTEIVNVDYFSDPHLVYRPDLNRIECWYRITHRDHGSQDPRFSFPTTIIRKYSTDGITWSERETLIDLQSTDAVDNMVRSHAVMWDSERKVYRMWWVDKLATVPNRDVVYAESVDGLIWLNKKKCTLTHYIDPWHLDVYYHDGKYHLLNYPSGGNLHHYISDDGINFKFTKTVLKLDKNEFYSDGFYRSCLIHDGEFKLYFSANTSDRTYIGLMTGDTIDNLNVYNGNYHITRQVFNNLQIENTTRVKSEIILSDKGTALGIDYDTERVYIKKSDGSKFYLE